MKRKADEKKEVKRRKQKKDRQSCCLQFYYSFTPLIFEVGEASFNIFLFKRDTHLTRHYYIGNYS